MMRIIIYFLEKLAKNNYSLFLTYSYERFHLSEISQTKNSLSYRSLISAKERAGQNKKLRKQWNKNLVVSPHLSC